MNVRRFGPVLVAVTLALSACVGGGGSTSSAAAEIELRAAPPGTTSPSDAAADTSDADSEMDEMVASEGLDEAAEAMLVATSEEVDAVHAECSTGAGRIQPGADFSNRTFSGPELRCADLSNASFRGAVLEGVDLSGANLTGADFTDATLLITAVGADFTRAVFTGADLQISDMRGATLTAADLRGSELTSLVGGLTLADLEGAQLGCNVLHGSPGINLADVSTTAECKTLKVFNRVTLAGTWYGSNLAGLDFGSVFVESTDFRRANLTGVNMADYGVFPAGADFSGAQLGNSVLTGVGFYSASFTGADFTGADLTDVFAVTSDFSRATFENVAMSGYASERNVYVDAVFNDIDLTGGSLSLDDFTDVVFGEINATDLVIDTISCPGAVSSSRYGLCTVGTDVAF